MILSKDLCKCGYCGVQWVHTETHTWQSSPRTCPHCGETKRIEFKELPSEGRDVFGYRFSPEFLIEFD